MRTVIQLPLHALTVGCWYVGRGRNGNVALWDGKHFLTIGSEFGSSRVKLEPYWYSVSNPKADPQNYGTFQPFLELDEGIIVEPVESADGAGYGYARTMVFDPAAQRGKP